jgi:hypothetical protein
MSYKLHGEMGVHHAGQLICFGVKKEERPQPRNKPKATPEIKQIG